MSLSNKKEDDLRSLLQELGGATSPLARTISQQIERKLPILSGLPSTGTIVQLERFITSDPDMLRLKEVVKKLANCDISVLILGETGTGKELLARALHGSREESGKSFVPINCTGLPDYLMESELFGHVRGAFTDAKETKVGLIQEADGGTLFLDEIGDMPMHLQAKLLRVLQDKCIRRVGDNKLIPVNFRLVSATNKREEDLLKYIREDIYWRLAGFTIKTKPLRDRPLEDAEMIAKRRDTYGKLTEKDFQKIRDFRVKSMLRGNVRELDNYINKLLTLGGDEAEV